MMFLLDLYKFCESYDWFNRQHLAKFVFQHRECERLARAANMTPRRFASSVSKEFCARMGTLGYLSIENGVMRAKGSQKRPYGFELRSLEGESNRYIYEMMNIEKLTDEELFGNASGNRHNYDALRKKLGIA